MIASRWTTASPVPTAPTRHLRHRCGRVHRRGSLHCFIIRCMPSMGDSIFIFVLALMLLGPKKLPQLARQLGKLMAEFRKASNDFRMQMEDELRVEEQKEHQAKVAALQPPTPATAPVEDPPHPHLPAPMPEVAADTAPGEEKSADPQLLPIAASGSLQMMPPSSGLPLESSARTRPDGFAEALPTVPENSIGGALQASHLGAGASSEEPAAELPPPPDRSQPVMAGEGERSVHL